MTGRILITGSRDWQDEIAIMSAIADVAIPPDGWTLVSGACPTGADAIGEAFAQGLGLTVERHPADWAQHGNRRRYSREVELHPSRFADPEAYRAWAARADAWAERGGLFRPRRSLTRMAMQPEAGTNMVRISPDTWIYRPEALFSLEEAAS